MSLPGILQELDRLDKFSPQFPDQLVSLLSGRLYKYRIRWLQDENASWLIDYLDNVCPRIALHLLSAQPA